MYSTSGEKILAEATRLFYAEGVNAIGVDRVAAESGVSKPTLYAQFGTKAGLIAAVLQRRSDTRKKAVAEFLESLPENTPSQVLAMFDRFVAGHTAPGFRGCPFTLTAAELPDPDHPARIVIADYKRWMRDNFARLAAKDGLSDPEYCADTFALLVDGANAQVINKADYTAMSNARRAAARIVAAESNTASP